MPESIPDREITGLNRRQRFWNYLTERPSLKGLIYLMSTGLATNAVFKIFENHGHEFSREPVLDKVFLLGVFAGGVAIDAIGLAADFTYRRYHSPDSQSITELPAVNEEAAHETPPLTLMELPEASADPAA